MTRTVRHEWGESLRSSNTSSQNTMLCPAQLHALILLPRSKFVETDVQPFAKSKSSGLFRTSKPICRMYMR